MESCTEHRQSNQQRRQNTCKADEVYICSLKEHLVLTNIIDMSILCTLSNDFSRRIKFV